MCKFHSVFLSLDGRVFTCGHGRGGRLGLGDEKTVLVNMSSNFEYFVNLCLFLITVQSPS